MVRFVNKLTGGDMWVHESRVEEYIAAGHKPAAPQKPKKTQKKQEKKEELKMENGDEVP